MTSSIAAFQPGYRVVRQKFADAAILALDEPWGTFTSADFQRVGLPMVVACTGCEHTMCITSPNCWADVHTRIWCTECRGPQFPTNFLRPRAGDRVSRAATVLYRLSQAFTAMMSEPDVHADECKTRWVSRRLYSAAVFACLEQGFPHIAEVLDEITRRTTRRHVYHSAIKAFIDEVAG